MLEPIAGHSRWLDPPEPKTHRRDCPTVETQDPDDCACAEIAECEKEQMRG